ncbi:MAG TPA: hypothetical protein VN256_13400 [Pyrinomonadaceae bacterium]|nr:hypothetical protein [Pyrinomonadaceae bacterium]
MKEEGLMFKRVAGFVFSLILIFGIFAGSLTASAQGAATRAREVRRGPAEVTVTLNEQFFNSLLEVVFTRLKAPSFPLSIAKGEREEKLPAWAEMKKPGERQTAHAGSGPGACDSVVRLEREMGGVKTAVRFEQGRVVAPLAFTGSYSVALIGCINFEGWADTVINLNFDRERQVLSARVSVVDIHLNNIPSLASGAVIGLVQNSIDRRINPVEILQATQLSTRVSIAGSGGALRLRATEIRPEVVPGALSLHIFYEFTPAD